jgi:hypothetical protein
MIVQPPVREKKNIIYSQDMNETEIKLAKGYMNN